MPFETQAVPVGIPTLVHTSLPSAAGGSLPPDLVVRGEFSGPGITGTVSLSTTPNVDFQIPGQAVKGEYVLSDIRLVQGDVVLAYALHRTAVITVTDVLLTQVTSRPLTYQEMVDQGIVVSKQDFSAYALYHVMSRGIERRELFRDDRYRERYLSVLERSVECLFP